MSIHTGITIFGTQTANVNFKIFSRIIFSFDAQLAYLRGFASSSNASIEATSELSQDVTHTQQMRKFTTHSLPRKLSTSRQKMFNNCNNKHEEVDQLAYYKNPSSPLFISKSMAIITPVIFNEF